MTATSLILVDDDPRLVDAWARLLATRPGIGKVTVLRSAGALADAIKALSPDVVIMDMMMPGEEPLVEMRAAKKSWPNVGFIAHSASAEPALIREAREAGASAFVDKLAPLEDMFAAIELVARGGSAHAAGDVAHPGRQARQT